MDISNISAWMRAPFLILAAILKFLIKNFISIIIIIITIIIIYCIFKFFIWWGKTAPKKKKIEEDETLGKES